MPQEASPVKDLPDPTRLRLLVDVAHHGSIAGAARSNAITASAVSQQLTTLERECGVPLLERLPRGVALTAAGEVLAERGRALVRLLEAARGDIDGFDDLLVGRVRIGTIASAAQALILPALARLGREHPGIDATVTVAEPQSSLAALHEGRIDLALVDVYEHAPMAIPPRVTATTVHREPLVLIGREPFAPGTTLADLADERWVMPPADAACGQATRYACRQAGFEPQVRWETDDMQLLSQAVAAGQGVALLPRLAIDVDRPGLHTAVPTCAELGREIRAVVRSGERERPLLHAVTDALPRG
ncbi:LysR family transcriptional regulator [Aeromicrobium duanguangcaii]|uniref:LysR family transcriptional regulator n=1 Tax=Aeromicrobium duanguangcaii TaxID=2968086 RepID=A0ABY5KGM9_9ACTN|nr:LysR family transcriptional regulator [Aeromicrobium duanguangcaii]MCD9153446.1 LysR family transcriptional regulator [Aeromicrobium duanguangcaii]UUI69464.1 LysR family transcriptional regulator [Aeromicrobium duanguangcaii]